MQITVRRENIEEIDEPDFASNFLYNLTIFRDLIAILDVKKSLFTPKMPNDVTMTSFLTSLSTSDENANQNVAVSKVQGSFCKKPHVRIYFRSEGVRARTHFSDEKT